MCSPDLRNEFGTGIKSVLICGIEAHVCVYHVNIFSNITNFPFRKNIFSDGYRFPGERL